MKSQTPERAREKISATLDREVLRKIRERTDNVSAYLNEAAEDRLYWEHIREMIRELEKQGFSGEGGMPRLAEITKRAQRRADRRRLAQSSRSAAPPDEPQGGVGTPRPQSRSVR